MTELRLESRQRSKTKIQSQNFSSSELFFFVLFRRRDSCFCVLPRFGLLDKSFEISVALQAKDHMFVFFCLYFYETSHHGLSVLC